MPKQANVFSNLTDFTIENNPIIFDETCNFETISLKLPSLPKFQIQKILAVVKPVVEHSKEIEESKKDKEINEIEVLNNV